MNPPFSWVVIVATARRWDLANWFLFQLPFLFNPLPEYFPPVTPKTPNQMTSGMIVVTSSFSRHRLIIVPIDSSNSSGDGNWCCFPVTSHNTSHRCPWQHGPSGLGKHAALDYSFKRLDGKSARRTLAGQNLQG